MTDEEIITDEEIEEAYEAAYAFRQAIKDLRKKMIDEKLTDDQIDQIADYLHDNIRAW